MAGQSITWVQRERFVGLRHACVHRDGAVDNLTSEKAALWREEGLLIERCKQFGLLSLLGGFGMDFHGGDTAGQPKVLQEGLCYTYNCRKKVFGVIHCKTIAGFMHLGKRLCRSPPGQDFDGEASRRRRYPCSSTSRLVVSSVSSVLLIVKFYYQNNS
jgi:hypothetical protein